MLKIGVLAVLLLSAACDGDPTDPDDAGFTVAIRGATTLDLAGNAFTDRVYTEAIPAGRYTIFMSQPLSTTRARQVLIDCPENGIGELGVHALQSGVAGCRGVYRMVEARPDGPVVIEEAVSATGSAEITSAGNLGTSGNFQFSAPLFTNGQLTGTVTVSGTFRIVTILS